MLTKAFVHEEHPLGNIIQRHIDVTVCLSRFLLGGKLFKRGANRMAWLYVLLAAIVEVFWVIGLRYSETILEWLGTMIAIVFSFFFIIKACEQLPAGTVYATFTGSGAAAIVLIDFLFFGADFSMLNVFFIALIIVGVIGIKLTSDEHVSEKETPSSEEGVK